jgi:16S rRNA (uracil1498-N3)-methyltransferase
LTRHPMPAHRFNFFVPSLSTDLSELEIEGDEHHHLARVLRLDAGHVIAATNGRGLLVEAEIVAVGKTRSAARVTQVVSREPPSYRVVLAMSLLPRAHFEQAVSQCTEVGVTSIVPLIADKCHVKSWSKASAARAERVAVAAMKQSGRSWLPTIDAARTVEAMAREIEAGKYGRALVGDRGGAPWPGGVAGNAIVLVGPEAGFTTAEMTRLDKAGVLRVEVSANRLRSETAAVVMVSTLSLTGAD